MRRAVEVSILSVLTLAMIVPVGAALPSSAVPGTSTWTIMMYMSGNAYPELPWAQNLNEMESAPQAVGTNVIALVDPYAVDNTTLYRVVSEPGVLDTQIVSEVIDDGGMVIPSSTHNANMADPRTLSAFIQFAATYFPADNYVLVLWGHGDVWHGLCPDGPDILTLPELRSALAVSTSFLGRPIDLVGVDACTEASLEMFFEIKDYVRYFVGSEKNMPLEGLPYRAILSDLASDAGCPVEEFGKTVAREYVAWAKNYSLYTVTMSVFNLTRMPSFADEFSSWVRTGSWYEGLFHSVMRAALTAAEHYEIEWQDDFGEIGTHMLPVALPLELELKTLDVMRAYQEMRVYSAFYDCPDAIDGIRAISPTGAVVYCPGTDPEDSSYSVLEISSSGWLEFSHMLRRAATSNDSLYSPSQAVQGSTLTFSWSASFELIEAWAFREEGAGLVPCGEFTSAGSSISIDLGSLPGSDIFSVSAGSSGTATSYVKIQYDSTGSFTVNITLTGASVSGDVSVIATTGAGTIRLNATVTADNRVTIALGNPSQAVSGDVADIRVETADGLWGTGSLLLANETADLTIYLHESASERAGGTLFLGMAVLAACLIIAFAAMLHFENKRKR